MSFLISICYDLSEMIETNYVNDEIINTMLLIILKYTLHSLATINTIYTCSAGPCMVCMKRCNWKEEYRKSRLQLRGVIKFIYNVAK